VLSSRVESYVTTDGQSGSLSWNKAPIWGLQPDFCCCQTVAGLLMWDALSNERTGLSFKTAAGPRQRDHNLLSQIQNLFSSPPKTLRATVEVFDPPSTRDRHLLSLSLMLRPTVSRLVCLGKKHPSGAYDQIFVTVRQLRVC
jgi:hypothetical protein